MSDGLALSALDWWAEAGVDTLVDEAPRDWLARPRAAATPPDAPPAPAPDALPATIEAFRQWLLTSPLVPGAIRARHDAIGDPASGCMIIVDMPEISDRGTAQLLTGEAGALFDRMLTAIGLERKQLYLAPFAPARPATGKIDKADCATLGRLMRHHLALVAPKRLLLLGDAPACALLDAPAAQARGRMHQLEIAGATIPTIATFPPRLVQGTDMRRSVWADLQAFQGTA